MTAEVQLTICLGEQCSDDIKARQPTHFQFSLYFPAGDELKDNAFVSCVYENDY